MIKGLFGVNIAVKDLDAAMAKFAALTGCECEMGEEGDFAFPGLIGAGIDFEGKLIGLLSSDNEDNPVGRFLSKRGEGVLLISIMTDDIEADQKKLEEKGFQFMMPAAYQGPYGMVNFIPAKSNFGVQVELIQPGGKFAERLAAHNK